MKYADSEYEFNLMLGCHAGAAVGEGMTVPPMLDATTTVNIPSQRIRDIIDVIDDIAFRIGELARNAAGEAAGVDSGGRDFAAAISEMRSLARRSASAAKEFKLLAGGLIPARPVSGRGHGDPLPNAAGTAATEDQLWPVQPSHIATPVGGQGRDNRGCCPDGQTEKFLSFRDAAQQIRCNSLYNNT